MAEIEKSVTTRRIKLGSILIVLFLLLYIPSVIFWVYGKNVSTDIVRMGEIEDSVSIDAVIVRDEVVLNSPVGGKCIKEINEGEKVKSNARIATVLNGSSEKLLQELKQLDLRIIDAQEKRNENLELFSDDLEKIENEIEEKLKQVILLGNTNELSEIEGIKKEVDELIQKKAAIAGGLSSPDAHIKSLLDEKKSLQQRISANTKDITTSTSGVVSYMVDGYEGILTPDKISDYTLDDIDNIEVKGTQKDIEELGVEANKPFAKLITGIEYYLVMPVDTKKANGFKVDNVINIRLNEFDKVIKGDVFFRSNNLNGKSILAVKVSNALSETAALRKVNIDLIKSQYSGFKVPLRSLTNVDLDKKIAELCLVKANHARFVKVKIVGKNEEFAIVENADLAGEYSVSLYSSYIVNPVNIEEGQTIN
ncbi:HlyD family efflux transporter periplasmic adaptor subunit [Acetivibrio cellulolyticus]|uniref:HlyD family efflux transporter periplasmic adaptor subunit n=1 Tax=Acetivibrio cellulolyticus TaxID=35830 RepID=UPI0001E2D476|nr:HlyD family efflux transporter periplasmic adaptor subunit [Acetivibrio cellulolyticus]